MGGGYKDLSNRHACLCPSQVKCIPFLNSRPILPHLDLFTVKQIMAQPLVTVCVTDTLEALMRVLTETDHNAFPVVSAEGRNVLVGAISRTALESVLALDAETLCRCTTTAKVGHVQLPKKKSPKTLGGRECRAATGAQFPPSHTPPCERIKTHQKKMIESFMTPVSPLCCMVGAHFGLTEWQGHPLRLDLGPSVATLGFKN